MIQLTGVEVRQIMNHYFDLASLCPSSFVHIFPVGNLLTGEILSQSSIHILLISVQTSYSYHSNNT